MGDKRGGKHSNDRLQGTLDLLVLRTVASRGPLHGYAITVERALQPIIAVLTAALVSHSQLGVA